MQIRLTITGRMYHLASDQPERLSLAEDASVADAIAAVQALGADGDLLPPTCLVALNGEHLGTVERCAEHSLAENDELTFVAPVAGG